MNWTETRQFLAPCFPEHIRSELDMLLPGELREIRIRADRPTVFVTGTRTAALPWAPGKLQLEALLEALSEHSIYARADETSQGFLTLRGGHRMGLCGRVANADFRSVLSDTGSVCIRIAGEWPGAADPVIPYFSDGLHSILVIGPPGSGKTTLLRDLARQLGSGRDPIQVSIVDERSEIAACMHGVPQLDVGTSTDVLDGLAKQEAIPWLVRSMAPQLIVTDELGSAADAEAVLEAISCGVAVCASAHGTGIQDVARKPALASMMEQQVFGLYVVLSAEGGGRIASIRDRIGRQVSAE